MANRDNEIDAVAREMTAGEPDAAFPARVLARIQAVETPWWSRPAVWRWSPLAVAAMAVLAILMVRPVWKAPPTEVRPKPETTVRLKPDTTYASGGGSAASSSTESPVARSSESSVTQSPESRVARSSETRDTSSYVASAFRRTRPGQLNSAEAVVSDLAPPPIEIDPIGLESMEAMESIQVPTLAVARIDVPAIGDE